MFYILEFPSHSLYVMLISFCWIGVQTQNPNTIYRNSYKNILCFSLNGLCLRSTQSSQWKVCLNDMIEDRKRRGKAKTASFNICLNSVNSYNKSYVLVFIGVRAVKHWSEANVSYIPLHQNLQNRSIGCLTVLRNENMGRLKVVRATGIVCYTMVWSVWYTPNQQHRQLQHLSNNTNAYNKTHITIQSNWKSIAKRSTV